MAESEHVRLARQAIEAYVRRQDLPDPEDAPSELKSQRSGAFVSIKEHGALRGCIGTIEPTSPNLATEIIRNAVQASTCDPRFEPVREEELPHLSISVDVLHPAEPVADVSDLDPECYGVIVACDMRRGLLLPNLEGVDTAHDQVAIACQKAGILAEEPFALQRFKVDRFT